MMSLLPNAVTEGRGTITTTCVLSRLPRVLLRSLLPRELSLLDDGHEHARIVLLLSYNHFTSWFGDMRYRELILGVPDVSADDRTRCMYMRRLYLDQKLPQLLGSVIYGYEKLPARIRWEALREGGRGLDALAERYRYQAEDRSGRPLLGAAFEPASASDATFAAGLARMWDLLAQPIVSQAPRRLSSRAALERGGPFLRSTITYDAAAAVTRPVSGRVRFGAGFDPRAIAELELDVPALGDDGLGAVAWHSRQVVSLPAPISAG